MTIHVHIDRLVLDGFSLAPSDATLVHAAVERELVRLVASRGLAVHPATGGAFASVTGGALRGAPTTRPAALGVRIAGVVYSAIGERR